MMKTRSPLMLALVLCGSLAGATHRVYAHLMNPREHPDDARRAVRPPDWSLFGGVTHFTSLRGFGIEGGRIVGFNGQLERYTRTYDLGDVIWPSYPILFASNLGDLADEIKRRDLFLFGIWGYVPGSGPGGYWQQFKPPAGVFDLLESKLHQRWLGMENGEQDGRYISGYALQMGPPSASRFEQYLNFHRHFERLTSELGDKMTALLSLNFGHYFLKEGIYSLIGAETAQALPNSQVYYSFIRGAGKQYGVPWFGNASVYNRWGYKAYDGTAGDHGPRKGASLSLLKRLLYSHILYNSMVAGYESQLTVGQQLSPIGLMQQSAQRWVRQNGSPGVMLTPIAVMSDFYSGWSFPRHLYSSNVYRVWGNLPYERGDYLVDLVLDMLYPGYQDSSYFHDESGFITPTPYGDSADCLLSDAPGWLLARYPVLVVAGDLTAGAEIRDKLREYALHGGRLVISASNVSTLGGLAGVPLTVIADPAAVPNQMVTNEVDKRLQKPYRLTEETHAELDRVFRDQVLFEAGEGLSLITNRRAPGEYTLGITNSSYRERPFQIVSRCGPIESISEVSLDMSEKGAPGYLPEGFEDLKLGASGKDTIAGGDIRIFRVHVREQEVEEIPDIAPPPAPSGRILPLHGVPSVQEAVLARPTFFQKYDGVLIDWRYLAERERAALEHEGGWIRQQKLRVVVDLTSGLNLFPDLRLVDNLHGDYQTSMSSIDDVLAKMPLLGASDLIVSLHRTPENNITEEQTWAGFENSVREICRIAAARAVTVHLRTSMKPPENIPDAVRFVRRVGAGNLRIAASTAFPTTDLAQTVRDLQGLLGFWLAAAPRFDAAGKLWSVNSPIADEQRILEFLKTVPAAVVFDVVYREQDEEYLDARALGSRR